MESQWKPIATAPLDRDVVLLVQWKDAHMDNVYGHFIGWYDDDIGRWRNSRDDDSAFGNDLPATHWLPLPELPEDD